MHSVAMWTKLSRVAHSSRHRGDLAHVKSNHFHFNWETEQGDPISTLRNNSLPQFIITPLTEKWTRGNHGVRLLENDPDANLSNLRFAADILLISGSLKHTTTSFNGTQFATTIFKTKIIYSTTSKPSNSNTVGTRSEHGCLKELFLHGENFFHPIGKGPRLTHSSPQGKSALCVQRVDSVSTITDCESIRDDVLSSTRKHHDQLMY